MPLISSAATKLHDTCWTPKYGFGVSIRDSRDTTGRSRSQNIA